MSLRIVFMGTPEFAVESLKALVESGANVVGVVTAPDKPKGRGKKLSISAVKEYAQSVDLNILQPTNLKSPEFLEQLRMLNPDLQIVVAFRMLPEVVWSQPPKGTFNLHGSLLPQYRGAAPINWAIINGEKETGVTTFFLKHEIDTGSIIFQERTPIQDDDNVGTVYERLMQIGSQLVLKTVRSIEQGNVEALPQDESIVIRHAPKIFKEDCQIDWHKNAEQVSNFIRGLSPYPAAWTIMHDQSMKVYKASIDQEEIPAGTFLSDGKTYIKVGCQDGSISIQELQLQGKKRMKVEDLLRGYRWP
ncbi:MAG: methionyl-tRNA formyltransferase [Cyclobacteriaceae bacterium]